jgi:hypothetical protein
MMDPGSGNGAVPAFRKVVFVSVLVPVLPVLVRTPVWVGQVRDGERYNPPYFILGIAKLTSKEIVQCLKDLLFK